MLRAYRPTYLPTDLPTYRQWEKKIVSDGRTVPYGTNHKRYMPEKKVACQKSTVRYRTRHNPQKLPEKNRVGLGLAVSKTLGVMGQLVLCSCVKKYQWALRNTLCYGPRLVTPIRKFTRVSLSLRTLRASDAWKKRTVCLLPTIDKNCDYLCLPYRTTVW